MGTSDSWASSPGRRRIMQANRSRDTKPEMAVRKLLHAAGFRYRVSYAPVAKLRRRADIVFTRQRIAVFIDGCFWHGCPEHGRAHFNVNRDYWSPKISTNRLRDEDTNQKLTAAGWVVLRFWEHQDPNDVARDIAAVVNRASADGSAPQPTTLPER